MPRPIRPYSPLVRPSFLPWLTDSYISNRFLTRGLLIALMMEAERTSETLVNFYQTTRCYNPEDSHLQMNKKLLLNNCGVIKEHLQHLLQETHRGGDSRAITEEEQCKLENYILIMLKFIEHPFIYNMLKIPFLTHLIMLMVVRHQWISAAVTNLSILLKSMFNILISALSIF
jgi:hypothetical protein